MKLIIYTLIILNSFSVISQKRTELLIRLKNGEELPANKYSFRNNGYLHVWKDWKKTQIRYQDLDAIVWYYYKKNIKVDSTVQYRFIDRKNNEAIGGYLKEKGKISLYSLAGYHNNFINKVPYFIIDIKDKDNNPIFLCGYNVKGSLQENVLKYFNDCEELKRIKIKRNNLKEIVNTYNNKCYKQ